MRRCLPEDEAEERAALLGDVATCLLSWKRATGPNTTMVARAVTDRGDNERAHGAVHKSSACASSQPGRYESTTVVDEECLRGPVNSCKLIESSWWKRRARISDHATFPSSCLSCATCWLLYFSMELQTEERDQCRAYPASRSAARSFPRRCSFRFGDASWVAVTASSSSTAAKGTASTSIRTSLLVLLHSICSPRRFRNGWHNAQKDDPAEHPHRVSLTLARRGFQNALGGARGKGRHLSPDRIACC